VVIAFGRANPAVNAPEPQPMLINQTSPRPPIPPAPEFAPFVAALPPGTPPARVAATASSRLIKPISLNPLGPGEQVSTPEQKCGGGPEQ